MTDNKQQLLDEREEAMLELLMKEYVEAEGAALWQRFQEADNADGEDSARKREDRGSGRRSDGKNRRIDFLNPLWTGCKRAAVIFLVLVCLLSPLVMSVEAFKIPVLNYIVDIKEKFSGFNFGKNEDLTREQEAIVDLILAAPFPEEYIFLNYEVAQTGRIWMRFTHNGRIALRITILPSEGQINVDTEDVDQIEMKIYDYEAVYLQKNGHRLMWMDAERELVFDLYASELKEDEFWRYVYKLAEKLS